MPMMMTRREILATVHADCKWSVDDTRTAIEARFPGTADVDLVALIDAWRKDRKLKRNTLGHCLTIAVQMARSKGVRGINAGGAFSPFGDQRAALETLRDAIEAHGAP